MLQPGVYTKSRGSCEKPPSDTAAYTLSPNFTYTFSILNNSYSKYWLVITANGGAYSTPVAEVQMYE
ncbi:hypothetical protein [Paenibacillus sp. MMS18-CY102]|uniref:hypothetical protein n=1 Tax=Paenibacillus sp. MMS18-CY102 TaxID=2682849 RepID=UPI00136650BC|nr:hypothetical protein [Paenibacillus sp. MMS18-CY102]MWC30721.1 hypothetical protein [Paenibacillus sp. MMS18-CY102]